MRPWSCPLTHLVKRHPALCIGFADLSALWGLLYFLVLRLLLPVALRLMYRRW